MAAADEAEGDEVLVPIVCFIALIGRGFPPVLNGVKIPSGKARLIICKTVVMMLKKSTYFPPYILSMWSE